MIAAQRLAAVLTAFAVFGCSSHTPSVAATSGANPSNSSSAPSAAPVASKVDLSQSFQSESIVDPTLKMTAYDVKIPAGFKFQGMYVPGSSCESNPYPVFRAYSADGLMDFRELPRFDWSWNNTPYPPPAGRNCLNIQQELSPQEFIKYLVGVLQVAYVSDQAPPAAQAATFQQTLANLNARGGGMHMEGGMAAAVVQYRNGSFTMEEQIGVTTLCGKNMMNIPGKSWFAENCSAFVTLTRAPQGQLTALVNAIQAQKGGANANQQWSNAYMQTVLNKMVAQNNAVMAARQAAFNQAQAIRAQEHQQFLAQMQAGTDRSMAAAAQVANTNHMMAQDWCDYALDQQTVAGAGGTAKVSSAYSQTWSNGSQYYQTNDPNVNPGPGWTLQTKVHGDGTPY
ncbi:MAG TPA: hypothetical protein VGF88_18880 [Acidobacteriaceae bacterium]|jgi:hypothetical protein